MLTVNVYVMDMRWHTVSAAFILFVWFILNVVSWKPRKRKVFQITVVLLSSIAIVVILWYSALHRTSSVEHSLLFFAAYSKEFYREMFMNALLYVPLGMSMSALIGSWSVLVGFVFSVGIEAWQYFAGTGIAQGTDVIMNTLGAAIGTLPWIIARLVKKKRALKKGEK